MTELWTGRSWSLEWESPAFSFLRSCLRHYWDKKHAVMFTIEIFHKWEMIREATIDLKTGQ